MLNTKPTQVIDDPAVHAEAVAHNAERAFVAVPARSIIDELSTPFLEAESEWRQADQTFADAVPTTPKGVLAKLREVARLLDEMDLPEHSLEMRHVQSMITYMERLSLTEDCRLPDDT